MKYFFKFAIRLYWFIVPNSLKGVCLFEESCSKHVYRTLQNEGTKAGFKALVYRFKVCRSPFLIRKNKEKNQYELHLCNGEIIQENLINSYHLSNKN